MANNGAMVVSPQDRDLMIRTVIGEAGSDPSATGVAAVVANRMRKFGQSATQVVLAPNQFEPWSTRSNELLSYPTNSAAYQNAANIVDGILSGKTPDPTNGAMQFYAPAAQKALGRPAPSFEDGTGVQIGAHRFFGGQAAASNDWLSQSAGTAAPASASAGTVAAPSADWLSHSAGTQSAAIAGDGAGAALAPSKQVYDLGDGTSIPIPPPGGYVNQPATEWSPTQPLSTQFYYDARDSGNYVKGQLAGFPGAWSSALRNSAALTGSGVGQITSGDVLPSFPSADPHTWGAGGALKTAAGMAGMVFSPLTAATKQFVQDPVTDMSGNPDLGERAGLAANVLGGAVAPGILSSAVSKAGSAAANGVIGTLSPDVAQLAALARTKYNIPITASDLAPINSVTRIGASALNRLPFSGASDAAAAQQGALNRAVANEIGESAASLTPDVMNNARTRIGNDFDTVAQNTTLQVDPQFVSDLHSVMNHAGLVLTDPEAAIISKQGENIFDKINQNTGTISGDTYQALTRKGSPLDALMSSENPNIAYAAQGLRDSLDSMLQRSASPDMQGLLTQARQQWAALKTIQPLVAKAPTGDVSPALLAGAVNRSTGNGMAFGWGGNLGELARIGQRFLKEPGSSNTAERTLANNSVFGAGKLIAAGGLGALGVTEGLPALTSMSGPEMAATAAAVPAGLALARGVSAGLRSDWLTNALISRSLSRAPMAAGAMSIPSAIMGGAGAFAGGGLNQPLNLGASPLMQPLSGSSP